MISIIITFYTGINILNSNLHLLQETVELDAEIIIVNDNPSHILNKEELSVTSPIPLKIINLPQNKGYAAACNIGAMEANGEFLLFLDCDILVDGNWLQMMVSAYHSQQNCGAVSATILDLQRGNVVHWGLGISNGFEVIKPYRDGIMPECISSGVYSFKLLTYGCILIPKKIFFKVKVFDEVLYNGYCDLDLTFKIHTAGYGCFACSDAIVYHRGKVSGYNRLYAEEDTRALFISKWKGTLPSDGYDLLSKLYNNNIDFMPSSDYMLINFSRSLFAHEYHNALKRSLSTEVTTYYELRDVSRIPIILEDYLSWSICGKNSPIIYFADNITSIENNYHWFSYRKMKGDLVADRNGNLYLSDSLLI